VNQDVIFRELLFKAVRSSGAGGQHVNKVATKVELSFDILNSEGLSETEKERLVEKLENRLTKDHILLLQGDTTRSQHRNKEIVITRFFKLLTDSLKVSKKRKPTKPSKSAIEKRLQNKQKNASKKESRKKPNLD